MASLRRIVLKGEGPAGMGYRLGREWSAPRWDTHIASLELLDFTPNTNLAAFVDIHAPELCHFTLHYPSSQTPPSFTLSEPLPCLLSRNLERHPPSLAKRPRRSLPSHTRPRLPSPLSLVQLPRRNDFQRRMAHPPSIPLQPLHTPASSPTPPLAGLRLPSSGRRALVHHPQCDPYPGLVRRHLPLPRRARLCPDRAPERRGAVPGAPRGAVQGAQGHARVRAHETLANDGVGGQHPLCRTSREGGDGRWRGSRLTGI